MERNFEEISSTENSPLYSSEESNIELDGIDNFTNNTIEIHEEDLNKDLHRLSVNFNIYHEILYIIFQKNDSSTGNEINIFYLIAFEIKKKIIEKKNKTHILNIGLTLLAANKPTEINLLDLMIFQTTQKKKLIFVNIFKFLRPLLHTIENLERLEISYNDETEEIESTGTFAFEIPDESKKEEIAREIIKKIENLIVSESILPAFYVGKRPVLKEVFRIKKTYSKKENTDAVLRIPAEKNIELRKNSIELTKHVDIDGIWGLCTPNNLSAIKAPLLLNFTVRDTAYSAISRSSYIVLDGNPLKLWPVLNFKIGTFQADPNFPIHLFIVTKYLARHVSTQKINVLSLEIMNSVEIAFKKLKNIDSYTKYILSSESNNDFAFNRRDSDTKNWQEKSCNQIKFSEIIPGSLIQEFFGFLSSDPNFTRIVKCFYIESYGNKKWSSAHKMSSLYHKLEKIMATDIFDFLRIDFALSLATCNKELENRKQSLYVTTNFYQDLSVRKNTLFCSRKIENINSSLWFIHKGKLVLDINSIDKINVYSCIIPELFSRTLRSSKACQITSKIVYDLMCKSQKSISTLPDTRILKNLRDTLHKLQRNNLMDHSFRIEFTTSSIAAPVKMQKAANSILEGNVFLYDTEPLYDYLQSMCCLLFNFIDSKLESPKDLLKLMIYEVLLLEVYVKGTNNLHFLANDMTRDYVRRLISEFDIPIHDPKKVEEKITAMHSESSIKDLLLKATKYSVSIPKSRIFEMYEFIGILFESDIQKIKNTIIDEFNRAMSEIPANKINIIIYEISTDLFVDSLIHAEKFIPSSSSSKLNNILVYIRDFRSDIKSALRHRLIDAAIQNQFLDPLEKSKNQFLYQKYRIVDMNRANARTSNSSNSNFLKLEETIKDKSYATKQRIIWSEYDTHRLYRAMKFYQNRGILNYSHSILQDLRFCFWAAVTLTQIQDRLKNIKKRQKKIDNQNDELHYLGDAYLTYDPENIAFSTILQIYTHRYGVELTLEMKEILLEKFILYHERDTNLASMLYTDESQKRYKPFYTNSPEQMSVLGVRAFDLHRIAYDMLSVVRRKNKQLAGNKECLELRPASDSKQFESLPQTSNNQTFLLNEPQDILKNSKRSDEYTFEDNSLDNMMDEGFSASCSIDNDILNITDNNQNSIDILRKCSSEDKKVTSEECSEQNNNDLILTEHNVNHTKKSIRIDLKKKRKMLTKKKKIQINIKKKRALNNLHTSPIASPTLTRNRRPLETISNEEQNKCLALIKKNFRCSQFTVSLLRKKYYSGIRPTKERLYNLLKVIAQTKKIKLYNENPETYEGSFALDKKFI